jgi:hypothetical protein
VAILTTRCPNNNHHPLGEPADGDHPSFAVINAKIVGIKRVSSEDQGGIGEIEPAGGEGQIALRRIEGYLHNLCSHKNSKINGH